MDLIEYTTAEPNRWDVQMMKEHDRVYLVEDVSTIRPNPPVGANKMTTYQMLLCAGVTPPLLWFMCVWGTWTTSHNEKSPNRDDPEGA